jgi:hypothetical protein
VAVANTGGTITILTGTGTGALNFIPRAAVITAGGNPSSLVVSDLDRDGKLDLATANAGSGDLSVLLGDGTAGFIPAPGTPVPTGGISPSALAAGDLNGDGKLDLAAVNAGSASVSVLLNGVAPPLGGFVSFPAAPTVGQQVMFAYSAVGPIASIDWDLNGDGVFDDAQGATAARAFAAPATYAISLRVTDLDGLATTTTRLIAVGLATPAPPLAPLPRTTLISPFPIVRVTGRTARRGARIKALEVFAPAGARVTVNCKGKRCPFRKWRRTAGAKPLSVGPLRGRFLPARVRLQVRVYKAGLIGKYTRLVIRRRKPPARRDLCLAPGKSTASQCPVT